MDQLIRSIGRMPQQRTTLYGTVSNERQATSFSAPELTPVVQTAPKRKAVA